MKFSNFAGKKIQIILALMLLLQVNHANHQHQDILSLQQQVSSQSAEIDSLESQLDSLRRAYTTLNSTYAESLAKQKSLQSQIDEYRSGSVLQLPNLGSNSGATGLCNDGTETFAQNHQGACSWHGGVDYWY